jgi:AcrR family transcriptional regulator
MHPRVPRQARSRAKYQALLQAALSLFRERGYTETTVDAIVERSGVSVGVFYSYFASKQQLLFALFQQETEADDVTLFSLPQRKQTAEEVEAMLWTFLEQRSALRHVREELQLINAEFAQQERIIRQKQLKRLELDIEQLRLAGYIRDDIRSATCAWMLLTIFSRLAELQSEHSKEEMVVEVQATARLIHHMFHADESDPLQMGE